MDEKGGQTFYEHGGGFNHPDNKYTGSYRGFRGSKRKYDDPDDGEYAYSNPIDRVRIKEQRVTAPPSMNIEHLPAQRDWKKKPGEIKYKDNIISMEFDQKVEGLVVNGIAEGTSGAERKGRQIDAHYWRLTGFIRPKNANQAVPQLLKLYMVWDLSGHETKSYSDHVHNFLNSEDAYSARNRNYMDRFLVLAEKQFATDGVFCDPINHYSTGGRQCYYKVDININMRGLKQTFMGVTSATTDIQSGKAVIILIGEKSGDAEGYLMHMTHEFSYYDP